MGHKGKTKKTIISNNKRYKIKDTKSDTFQNNQKLKQGTRT